MPNIKDTLYTLQQLFSVIEANNKRLRQLQESAGANVVLDAFQKDLEKTIEQLIDRAESALHRLLRFPPQFASHEQKF